MKVTRKQNELSRGYFGIGIENSKTEQNIGTLFRSAYIFGADFIFTIGKRYKKQASDTVKSYKHMPLYNYADFADFYSHLPFGCLLVGIELHSKAREIRNYIHPEKCIYLLGAEDHGLSKVAMEKCHQLIVLPGEFSMNVSVAGSIVMFDRVNKSGERVTPALEVV